MDRVVTSHPLLESYLASEPCEVCYSLSSWYQIPYAATPHTASWARVEGREGVLCSPVLLPYVREQENSNNSCIYVLGINWKNIEVVVHAMCVLSVVGKMYLLGILIHIIIYISEI
jgi:hypothetical protein